MTRYEIDWEELRARTNVRRLAQEMSWAEMAKDVGLARTAMHKVANGQAVSANVLVTVLKHLGEDLSFVVRKTDANDN